MSMDPIPGFICVPIDIELDYDEQTITPGRQELVRIDEIASVREYRDYVHLFAGGEFPAASTKRARLPQCMVTRRGQDEGVFVYLSANDVRAMMLGSEVVANAVAGAR